MAGQQPYGFNYGADYRSRRQPASQNPFRASTGNAAQLYAAYGGGAGLGGGGGGGNGGGHYRERDVPDDWSSTYYGDDITDDSVSEDFQRMSLGRNHPHGHHGHGHPQRPLQHPAHQTHQQHQQQQREQQQREQQQREHAQQQRDQQLQLHQQLQQLQQHQQAQQQAQQHPQARYNSYAANLAAGRGGQAAAVAAAAAAAHRGHGHGHREPSPTDSSFSRTTTSASTFAHQQQAQQAAAWHARHAPSKSLDRLSHYLQRGYRLAGPYRGEDQENIDPGFREEDRARGVLVPARSAPRARSGRRPSSPDARGREEFLGRGGPQYYSQSEKLAQYRRSLSQDRLPRERERERERELERQQRHARRDSRTPAALRRSSSIGRFENFAQPEKSETPPPQAGALVRRSKSVGPREAYRRRRSLGNINGQLISSSDDPTASTAVRLDLGGRDVDISINDRDKRRGPAIGSITINQHPAKDGLGLGAPSESGRTRTTSAMTEREREYEEKMRRFYADVSSSPPTSPEIDPDEFARLDRKLSLRQRPRSASLGTTLPRRKTAPLQIAPPPSIAGGGGVAVGNGAGVPGAAQLQMQLQPGVSIGGGGDPRHTRISRKIVTRQALEELGYPYEDTGDTFTVFGLLQADQIDELMDLTARIRAARHDRRRARSRGERQYAAEFRFDDYARKALQRPGMQRPVVNQEDKPYGGYRGEPVVSPPVATGPPMPGAWPAQGGGERRVPGEHHRYARGQGGPQGGPRGYPGRERAYYM
ncbi:hypothetical protein TWF696_000985 [Orbilia brochopaga]|uniref:DUF8035 domain-containing protein n=1 Tax=Orbilia brochopaga TaxID=3140254 RepID=A0AAV9VEJ7_9PEZI